MAGVTNAPGPGQDRRPTLRQDRWWLPRCSPSSAWSRGSPTRPSGCSCRTGTGSARYHYLTPFYSPCVSDGLHPGGRRVRHVPARRVVAAVRGADAAVPAAVPADLLLLPQGVLPRRSGCRRRRARSPSRTEVHRRDALPLIMQNLHRYFFYAAAVISLINTYDAIAGLPRPGRLLRHRARHRDPLDQRDRAVDLHGVLPLLPARHRRPAQPLLQAPGPLPALDLGLQAQHPAHAAGLDHARHPGVTDFYVMCGRRRLDHRPPLHQLTD